MYRICLGLVIVLLLSVGVFAQECGPNCPVCSGAGSSSGATLGQKSILFSGLSIPTAEEETTVINARMGILNWLEVGVGYAFKTETVLWNVRAQPLLEKKGSWRPGIIVGSGSVQTGGSDQSLYIQILKSVDLHDNFSLQLSTGVATLLPDFDENYGLAGITTSFFKKFAAFVSYDGKSTHEGASWIPSEWMTISFIMVESEFPAISMVLKM